MKIMLNNKKIVSRFLLGLLCIGFMEAAEHCGRCTETKLKPAETTAESTGEQKNESKETAVETAAETTDTAENADEKTEEKSKTHIFEYTHHDFGLKAKESFAVEGNLPFMRLRIEVPKDRYFSNDDPVFHITFPTEFLGLHYVKNGDSKNWDSLGLKLLFFEFGKNFDGETGGTARYGRWDKNRNRPGKYYFKTGEFNIFWKEGKPIGLNLEYDGDAVIAGLSMKIGRNDNCELHYNHRFSSDMHDELERVSGESFRNSFGLRFRF
jgi:hypothetical protein